MKATEYIWMDGKFRKWKDAKIHIFTHSLHYGGGIFEGIRFYENAEAILELELSSEGVWTSGPMKGNKIISSGTYREFEDNKAFIGLEFETEGDEGQPFPWDGTIAGTLTKEKKDGKSILEVRNKIHAGEELEVLAPDGYITTILMPRPLITTNMEKLDYVNHSQFILIDMDLKPYTIIRRV